MLRPGINQNSIIFATKSTFFHLLAKSKTSKQSTNNLHELQQDDDDVEWSEIMSKSYERDHKYVKALRANFQRLYACIFCC